MRIPPAAKQAIALTGAKISTALHYRHIGKVFPRGGLIDIKFDANIRYVWPERAGSMIELAPNIVVPKFQREDLSTQFVYRWTASDELGAFVAVLQYGSAFLLYCTLLDGTHAELAQAFSDSQVWNGPDSYRFA